jgi:hypothetical protein
MNYMTILFWTKFLLPLSIITFFAARQIEPFIGAADDLEVTINAVKPIFNKWTPTGFKIQVKNLGNQSFTDIEVTFPYPIGTANGGTASPSVGTFQQFCLGGTACYLWRIPSLAGGATASLDIPLYALDATTIVGTAEILRATPTDNNTVNNKASATMTLQTDTIVKAYPKLTQLIPIVIRAIAPNPTEDELKLDLESLDAREATFTFYNTSGQMIKSEKRRVKKGLNQVVFSVLDFVQGVYFVIPSTNLGLEVPTKFVKM